MLEVGRAMAAVLMRPYRLAALSAAKVCSHRASQPSFVPQGLGDIGRACLSLAAEAKRVVGLPQAFDRPTFKEFALDLGRPAEAVVKAARAQGVHPGYPLGRDYPGMENLLLVAVTEKRTRADIARLAEVLAA